MIDPNRPGRRVDPGELIKEPDLYDEPRWRPVETASVPLLEAPGTVLVEEFADGQHVRFLRLPASHPLLQALEQDPATFKARPRRTADPGEVMAWIDREVER